MLAEKENKEICQSKFFGELGNLGMRFEPTMEESL